MRIKNRISTLTIIVLAFSFLSFGCSTAPQPAAVKEVKADTSWQYTDIVDYSFVKPHVKIPAPKNVVLVDSRPRRSMFDKGHIPTSLSIPYTKFDKLADQLPDDKNTLLIFYCGGFKCKLSHKSAYKAEKMGYKNVKVYAAGYPDYMKKQGNYPTVSTDYMKSLVSKNADMVIIDSRPKRTKYDKGHMPAAISIPDTKFAKMTDQLPQDKSKMLIFYCGGFKCKLSHKSAAKAIAMGYTNVKVFAAGYPAWVKVAGPAKVKAGSEEGTIDIAYFKEMMAKDPNAFLIIDVRDPDEFAAGTFSKAINIPVDQLEAKIPTLPTSKPIVFVCATGARSGEAFYMVQDLRPELKSVFYLEAEITYHGNGTADIAAVM